MNKLSVILLAIFFVSALSFIAIYALQPFVFVPDSSSQPSAYPGPSGTPSPVQELATNPALYIPAASAAASGLGSAGSIVRGRIKRTKPVLLGASMPQQVCPGCKFTAWFVAYNKQLEKEVQNNLASLSARSTIHMDVKRCRWPVGTSVKVRFYGDYLKVAREEQEFVWDGTKSLIDFDVEASLQAPESTTVAKFDVSIDEILVATLRLDLQITSQKSSSGINRIINETPAETAFASYSSKDRQRVLDRVDAIQICGINVFLDCLSLHPGEKWKTRLEKEIHKRDIFILFWSRNAKDSKEVSWEWQTALKNKGKDYIQIQPLQPAFEAPPPDELRDLHFGSACMLARKAYENSVDNPLHKANLESVETKKPFT